MSLRKRPSFAKSFRNSFDSSAKIFAAMKPSLAHECHFAEQEPPFRSCELAAKLQSVKIPIFAVKAPFRRVFRSYETKFGTRVPFRSTVTSISKLRNGLRSGLQERLFTAKSTISKGGNAIAAVCSSPSPSPTTREPPVIFSGHHFQPNLDILIWREQEKPNLPLLPAANKFCERYLFKAPPLNLRGQKLFPLRRSPRLKILRRGVISLGQGIVPCKRGPGLKAQSP
ncbi:hypothetical protein VitviT2T_024575 [Vitis vinifera]|uniref:Uncharacterized protein n=1 Tax=Vitis vinifera TaxID=29760 RepID=A0ABY9DG61_VITVI|nr:hypothetical protein VitviT2T_024575 [Vitis vinifera]